MLFNSFVPYFTAYTVYAQSAGLQSNITFDSGKNSFQVSANTNEKLSYMLAYKTPGNIEGTAPTTVEKSDSDFNKEIYAGIKSGNDARKDEVVRGIYKIKVDSQNWFNQKKFVFENGSLKIVEDTNTGALEITGDETNWLETGTDTIEQICADSPPLNNNTYIDWNIDLQTGTAETKDKVQPGVTYIFPLENKVTVKFSCLPKNEALRTSLKIQQVKVSDLKLPDNVNPATEFAYDITTGMKDGGFKYEVTLPKIENQDAKVSYIEKTVDEVKNQAVTTDEIKTTDETKTSQETDQVKVTDLDHFTMYFITGGPTTARGSITIIKDTEPEWDHDLDFSFHGTLGNFNLHDDENKKFNDKNIGTYTVSEDTKSHWILTRINCTGASSFSTDLNNRQVTVNLQANENVSCTFQNDRLRSIGGYKWNDENNDGEWNEWWDWDWSHGWHKDSEDKLKNWTIFIDLNDNKKLDAGEVSVKTDNDGEYVINDLLPGTYDVCEAQQPGWDVTHPTDICQTITLSADGDEHHVNFGNKELPEVCGDGILNTKTEECDGSNLGGLPSTDFRCNKCELELIEPKITICHSDSSHSKPYETNKPNKSADLNGHNDHNGGIYPVEPWGDIIPPFYYIEDGVGKYYSGKNWPEGEDIWNNDCFVGHGTITVDKVTIPSNDPTNFSFTVSSTETGTNETFNLSDQSTPWSSTLHTGFYTISEGTLPTGWSHSNLTCTSNHGPMTPDPTFQSVSFDLNANENITCTFTNTRNSYCGDNNVDPGEQCDDGNIQNGDGCSSTCRVEPPGCPELFISEYIEGSGENKALEIYNPTSSPINLTSAGYKIEMYYNGNPSPGLTINLTGTVAANDVFVLARGNSDPSIIAQADQVNSSSTGWFNGNDAVVLKKGGFPVDVIGQIGNNPCGSGDCGGEWGSGLTSTKDNTLTRKCGITCGDNNGTDSFDPSIQWDGYARDTFNYLGNHDVTCPAVCGDKIKNQPNEECDGTDGVLYPDEMRCNSDCKLELINDKVTICHSTSSQNNPYIENTPNKSGDLNGHVGHDGPIWYPGAPVNSWGDIIPPFWYFDNGWQHFDGLNWTDGQSIWDNGCKIPSKSTVTVCKKDTSGAGLSGWQVVLRYENPVESINVMPNGTLFSSNILPVSDYVLRAEGTYTYRPNSPGAEYSDANFSKRLPSDSVYGGPYAPWVNVNTFPSPHTGWLGIMVNGAATNWSNIYNPSNIYALGYPNYSGNFNFQILDDQYSDNSGRIPVGIYEGWTKVTGENGCATFENVNLGNYYIEEILQDGWTYDSGVGNVTISKADETFTITNHELPKPGSILGEKFNDINGDGIKEEGELGLQGWTINLSNSPTNIVASTTTDINGHYSFTNVLPGNYTVCEVQQAGWKQTYPNDVSNCHLISLGAGQQLSDRDFGNVKYGTVTIIKDAIPNDAQDFRFSSTFGAFYLDDDSNPTLSNTKTYSTVLPGHYYINEDAVAGWEQGDISCTASGEISGLETHLGGLSFDLGSGGSVSCTFNNNKLNTIQGKKYNDLNNNGHHDPTLGDVFMNGWDIRLYEQNKTGWSLLDTKSTGFTGTLGQYRFQVGPGNYKLCEVLKSGWAQVEPTELLNNEQADEGPNCRTVNLSGYGQTVGDQMFGNVNHGKVIVTKYHDTNHNEIKDADEPVLPDWEINFDNNIATTSAQGQVTYQNILAGTYPLSENPKSGWEQTNISCDNENTELTEKSLTNGVNDNTHYVTVNPGETTNCYVGNYQIPRLSILKYNNKWPFNATLGGEVVFTIVLHIFDNNIKDLHVFDLLPNGFKFKPGTATMNGITMATQPEYHSPGDWQIGDVLEGDEITLQYTATIDSNQEPGLYKDLALAYGCEYSNTCTPDKDDKVIATSVDSGKTDPGVITDNHVGTKVNLVKEQQDTSSVNVTKQETQEQTGDVLGASTGLPATGGNTIWLIVSTIFALIGIISLAFGVGLKYKKTKFMAKFLTIVFIGISFFIFGQFPVMANGVDYLSIRLEQPQSPTRLNNFNLVFVTMDLLNQPITVKCFRNGVQFGSNIAVTAGGNTGICPVNSSVMPGKGTYSFYATAQTATDSVQSETVTVDYNTDGPGTPSSYSKEHSLSCQYKIKFKTADDGGKTTKVEIYRNLSTSFGLDPSNRIASISIGSNTDYTYVDNVPSDCDKEWYYALRAFDAYGNGSGWVGDSVVSVTTITSSTTTTTTTSTGQTGGAIPVVNVTLPSAEVLGAKTTPSPTTKASGEKNNLKESVVNVLGAATKKQNQQKLILVGIGLAALAIIGYVIYKKKKS